MMFSSVFSPNLMSNTLIMLKENCLNIRQRKFLFTNLLNGVQTKAI